MTPKVSVIIPNYNHGRYLRQRIDSVLHQTYKNFEIIILDDCSSDTSREVISEYTGNPFVREVVFNENNSGTPFKQWQRGIGLAQGEWIWLAESDDYADERFLEILISALDNRNNVGLLYCDSRIVTDSVVSHETFATIKNKKFNTNRWSENYVNNGMHEIENYLLPGGTINNTSAVLFNTKIVREVNPFDIPLRYIGDKYTFVKVLAHSDVVYVKEGLNYFRDPFNVKQIDQWMYYYYEQFLVFDWAYRNLRITNKKKFYDGFYSNTRSSLFRYWDKAKFTLYKKLFRINHQLLMKSIYHNFLQSVRGVLGRSNRKI